MNADLAASNIWRPTSASKQAQNSDDGPYSDRLLEDALAKKPDVAVTYYYLAKVYYVIGDSGKAIAQLKIATQLARRQGWWLLLGKWYEEKGMKADA